MRAAACTVLFQCSVQCIFSISGNLCRQIILVGHSAFKFARLGLIFVLPAGSYVISTLEAIRIRKLIDCLRSRRD